MWEASVFGCVLWYSRSPLSLYPIKINQVELVQYLRDMKTFGLVSWSYAVFRKMDDILFQLHVIKAVSYKWAKINFERNVVVYTHNSKCNNTWLSKNQLGILKSSVHLPRSKLRRNSSNTSCKWRITVLQLIKKLNSIILPNKFICKLNMDSGF